MKNRKLLSKLVIIPILALSAFSFIFIQGFSQGSPAEEARSILEKSGIKGGFIVHLNCGDGTLTEAFKPNESYLVQGLDPDIEEVNKARKYIASRGNYGPVSVVQYAGTRLPYKSNLVNMIVAEDLGKISKEEAMRVLAPNGVLMTKGITGWKKTVKPLSDALDEWNQYLYDAGNNPVSADTEIGPVREYQWIGSPRWGRHHDTTSSMSAMVSANGRIFYINDEGSKASIQLPAENYLFARDAYNGTILWKKSIPDWFNHLYTLKAGPTYLPRRLVAVGDRVYVTLGIDAALSELDAATGKVLRTFPGTKETSEILFSDNTLFLVIGKPEKQDIEKYVPTQTYVWNNMYAANSEYAWSKLPEKIMAVDISSGNVLWTEETPICPMSLSADSKAVYYYNGDKIISLLRDTGEKRWESQEQNSKQANTGYVPRMIVNDGIVLFSSGTRQGTGGTGQRMMMMGGGTILGYNAETGERIWSHAQPSSGHFSPEDVFVIDGVVWVGDTANMQSSGTYTGLDLHTGDEVASIKGYTDIYFFHQRCYISKATKKYLLPSRTGIEFVSLEDKDWDINHYTRGGCYYGIMPSNGLIYTPPNACTCYVEAKLEGLNALRPAGNMKEQIEAAAKENRLEKGPAYNAAISGKAGTDDWPTFRHDTARSSASKTKVPSQVEQKWQVKLGGKLSSPVVAGNQVFVSQVDAHTVYSINASTGKEQWKYTAGGRVDSPPTFYKGRVIFGSTDGYVYSLNAADGALIWRFRAAPMDLRMIAYEQVESVWPVHGSVLIQNDILYCVAGRSVFMDGGMRFLRLNPITGEKISESVMNEIDPETGKNLQTDVVRLNMPVGLSDILSSDGKNVYMRSQQFDLEGNRHNVKVRNVGDQTGEGAHVFSPIGFLDDSQISRSYMMYGKSIDAGWGSWETAARITPAGRLIAVDDDYVYSYGRKPEFLSESIIQECQLFAANKVSEEDAINKIKDISGLGGGGARGAGAGRGAGARGASAFKSSISSTSSVSSG